MTIAPKPRLIITEEKRPLGLGSVTWEQRRRMTAAELIKLMGPLHVHHPDYKERPHPLLPMPNLAGAQPVISRTEYGLFAQLKTLLSWAMR